MTLENRDAAYLWDMLQAAKEVAGMTSDVSVAEFKENIMLCRATERCLEIIGDQPGGFPAFAEILMMRFPGGI